MRTTKRMRSNEALVALSAALWLWAGPWLSGCSVIFGVDDYRVETDGGASGMDAGPTDAGADAGGPTDGGTDAGGADGGEPDAGCACSEPTPYCSEGECVECLDAAHCDDGDHCTADRCGLDGTCASTRDTTCMGRIAGGGYHTCALRNDRVYCWGLGSSGQLGLGTTVSHSTPQIVPGLTEVRAIETGNIHSCAVRADSSVHCWGHNSAGQIAAGAAANQSSPFQVPDLTRVVQIGLGYRHTCALRNDGTVACWGTNATDELGPHAVANSGTPLDLPGIEDAVQLGVGNNHSCVLRRGGSVWCWGTRSSGRLGDGGATTGSSGTPVQVAGLTDAVDLAVGPFHSCALRAGGSMVCWGGGASGALGDGLLADSPVPTTVVDTSGSGTLGGIRQMALGAGHTCVLRTSGELVCWGSNTYGELTGGTGSNRAVPTVVASVTGAVSIGLGNDHTCALVDTGRDALCWGRNQNGQLGDGTMVDRSTPGLVSTL